MARQLPARRCVSKDTRTSRDPPTTKNKQVETAAGRSDVVGVSSRVGGKCTLPLGDVICVPYTLVLVVFVPGSALIPCDFLLLQRCFSEENQLPKLRSVLLLPRKSVVLGNTSHTLLFQVKNKVSLSIHHVCSDAKSWHRMC